MTTPDYVVAQVGAGWTVAKFEGDEQPSQVYEVTLDTKGKPKCTCPAFQYSKKQTCKHIQMVNDFQLNQGEPQ